METVLLHELGHSIGLGHINDSYISAWPNVDPGNSCPTAQAFPAPVACRTFNADGVLASFSGLAPNTNYLFMVDGISNTRASFNLSFTGTALPVKIINFSGTANPSQNNHLIWRIENSLYPAKAILESSFEGLLFNEINTQNINSNSAFIDGGFYDRAIAGVKYYRLKIEESFGSNNILK